MNKNIKALLLLIFLSGSCCIEKVYANDRKYVMSGWPSGFFSNFLGVLNHLLWADANNRIPVIWWGKYFLYYEDSAPNQNAWDYYFEPASHLSYVPGDTIENARYYPGGWYPIYWSPGGYQIPYNHPSMFAQSLRDTCHGLIKKYVKIKPFIQEKIDSFYKENMENHINIGVHLRGTDKPTEVGHVDPYRIFAQANQIADSLGANCQFFVATDEERLLNLAKVHLNRNVIYRDSSKSESLGNQSHVQALVNPATTNLKNRLILGEEVLIDVLLLSKCNAFIHSLSLVSQNVSYFNPSMPCYLIRSKDMQADLEEWEPSFTDDMYPVE